MIRQLVAEDMAWVLELAQQRYPPFDEDGAVRWLLDILPSTDALTVRSDNAFLIGAAGTMPWRPQRIEAHVLFLCAEHRHHWQAVRLLSFMTAWAKGIGAAALYVGADTGLDLGPLARWVHGRPDKRYVVDFKLDTVH